MTVKEILMPLAESNSQLVLESPMMLKTTLLITMLNVLPTHFFVMILLLLLLNLKLILDKQLPILLATKLLKKKNKPTVITNTLYGLLKMLILHPPLLPSMKVPNSLITSNLVLLSLKSDQSMMQ